MTPHSSVRVLCAVLLVAASVVTGCQLMAPGRPGTFLVRAMNWPGCHVEAVGPECRPANLPDVRVVVMLADGSDAVVATGVTDDDGRVLLEIPAGTYLIGGGDVEGLTTPEPLLLDVASGGKTETTLNYTSGVRIDDDGHP